MLTVSYPDGDRHRLVVILGSSSGSAFTETDRALLTGAESAMGRLLTELKSELFRERVEQRSADLAEFLARSRSVSSLQEAFEQAAALIFRQGYVSLVRVSVPDRTGRFLESRVLLSTDTVTPAVPENGQMIISLMARHQDCLKNARTVLASVDNSDNRLIGIEIQQSLAEGIEQAMIVPVMVGKRPWALITVGFDRWLDDRAIVASQSLAETVAAVFGLVIPLCVTRRRKSVPDRRSNSVAGRDQELHARLRSSLTGILGSVEILRSREDAVDRTADNRYLEIIDRSARRIDALFQPEEPVSVD
jgi:hypothetical protein